MTRIAICAPGTPITRDVADRVGALAVAEFPQLALAFHEQGEGGKKQDQGPYDPVPFLQRRDVI